MTEKTLPKRITVNPKTILGKPVIKGIKRNSSARRDHR